MPEIIEGMNVLKDTLLITFFHPISYFYSRTEHIQHHGIPFWKY
jgi:hypothetical protein